ncbi:hypothetical protein ABMA27_006612 [Loxostege sticticalis]|uniref:FZ domain-containing protein n=1 Tax=Loxostege sticticalis TaxID=481309 RepID=A0ABR3IJW7_LOXSC
MFQLRKEDENQLVQSSIEMEKDKIVFKGSHPDSLYRVSTSSGVGTGKLAHALRLMRWPAALILVCVALAVFVYFLMPDNIETDLEAVNGTYWEQVTAGQGAGAGAQVRRMPSKKEHAPDTKGKATTPSLSQGTKTSEIDFYDADTDKNFDIASVIDTAVDTNAKRQLPIQPVFPSHITPEVQYGNERADSEKLRTPKILEGTNTLPDDSTLKPHITQKPEKPLEIYFKDGNGITTAITETIAKAETLNDFTNYGEKYTSKNIEQPSLKPFVPAIKERPVPQTNKVKSVPQVYEKEPDIPPEIQEFYHRRPSNVDVNFTSGHSKLFGISIEDAEKMRSTTQSSAYNTRVSPTLPTWRDGDDSTTKKYPVNVNYDVPQCRSTRLAFCRGVLPYDLAGPAATINGVEITNHLPQIEFLIATNCSERVQQFMCALLEPECNPPPYPPKTPCYNLCRAISDSCDGFIPRELSAALNCNQYSSSNCVAAKSPCYPRELGCGDGTCIPRDWICDGAADCPSGEDEAKCVTCQPNEFKCPSGGCILKRWMCDGYADCSGGEDEAAGVCEAHGIVSGDAAPTGRGEPGEESAGSAPAPAVRRPFRIPPKASDRAGDAESSKELLVTSDSTNALKRNYTRRPSLSRLTPYPRQKVSFVRPQDPEDDKPETTRKPQYGRRVTDKKPKESAEDVNVEDLGLFDDVDKGEDKKREEPKSQQPAYQPAEQAPARPEPELTHLDKTINKLEKVIDGAALLRKAAAQQDPPDSPETNSTTLDKDDSAPPGAGGMASAHASPCPSGELRCVDGRCITLAQLCDGTIDCFDHADEDNCYT